MDLFFRYKRRLYKATPVFGTIFEKADIQYGFEGSTIIVFLYRYTKLVCNVLLKTLYVKVIEIINYKHCCV